MQDDAHDTLNIEAQFCLRQILALGQPLNDEADHIKRLAPLVGYVVDHFSHGSHAVLLNEGLILLAQLLHRGFNALFKGPVQGFEQLLLVCLREIPRHPAGR